MSKYLTPEEVTKRKQLFGARVRIARKNSGLSQEALSLKIGKYKNLIYFIENGLRSVSIEQAFRLSRALKVSLPDLLKSYIDYKDL